MKNCSARTEALRIKRSLKIYKLLFKRMMRENEELRLWQNYLI